MRCGAFALITLAAKYAGPRREPRAGVWFMFYNVLGYYQTQSWDFEQEESVR